MDNFRKNKRFFSVVIKGVEGAYDLPRFSLSLQRQVKESLNAAGYSNIVVKSDFESAVQYVETHMQYTQDAIDKHEDLKDIAPTPESVISLLKDNNIQAYMELEEALYKTVGVPLTTKNVSEWLAEVEHAIETEGIADGLIIFWDEFTSIMEAIGSDRINVLQNIAEKSQSCNLFLFLISHRVEDQVTSGSKREDVKTMNDRFYTIRYMMDEVSTYKVMRHTFNIQGDSDYAQLRYNRTVKLNELIDYLCEGGVEDERKPEGGAQLHRHRNDDEHHCIPEGVPQKSVVERLDKLVKPDKMHLIQPQQVCIRKGIRERYHDGRDDKDAPEHQRGQDKAEPDDGIVLFIGLSEQGIISALT